MSDLLTFQDQLLFSPLYSVRKKKCAVAEKYVVVISTADLTNITPQCWNFAELCTDIRFISTGPRKSYIAIQWLFDDFQFFSFFTVYDFQNFDFLLDYCSLNKKKHFHTKNHPSNFIFLASRELFLFFGLYFHFPWLK
jgi:hypothetical protein